MVTPLSHKQVRRTFFDTLKQRTFFSGNKLTVKIDIDLSLDSRKKVTTSTFSAITNLFPWFFSRLHGCGNLCICLSVRVFFIGKLILLAH